ncbi:hypothetical protein [Desulfobacca acetoxidans]|uniref:Uncharacterized protein n=1 Tax=Desulfobacca acetoxidans (strain ATCC 700848 / DSM 11109 / ASRB2) TaxID=880072 RepID=F2NDC5_DESAR|nr:hypothetical protein [Desulfobacca acetoxidans]AEB09991.1 hypothetical protein Desac_2162 [Desulfobacca acetoxidans DSM 11109]
MKCPLCGSLNFYIKDAEDEYDVCEFQIKDGKVVFAEEPRPLPPDMEAFCNRCAWHGKFATLR